MRSRPISNRTHYGEEGGGLSAWLPSSFTLFGLGGGSLLKGISLGGPALGGIGAMSLRFGDVSCFRELSTLGLSLFELSEGLRFSCDDTDTKKKTEKAKTT